MPIGDSSLNHNGTMEPVYGEGRPLGLPVEILTVLYEHLAEMEDCNPLCLAITCQTTFVAWGQFLQLCDNGTPQHHKLLDYILSATHGKAAIIVLELGLPDPCKSLRLLASKAAGAEHLVK